MRMLATVTTSMYQRKLLGQFVKLDRHEKSRFADGQPSRPDRRGTAARCLPSTETATKPSCPRAVDPDPGLRSHRRFVRRCAGTVCFPDGCAGSGRCSTSLLEQVGPLLRQIARGLEIKDDAKNEKENPLDQLEKNDGVKRRGAFERHRLPPQPTTCPCTEPSWVDIIESSPAAEPAVRFNFHAALFHGIAVAQRHGVLQIRRPVRPACRNQPSRQRACPPHPAAGNAGQWRRASS